MLQMQHERRSFRSFHPQQETYKREEQRPIEILDAHWDLPIKDVNLDVMWWISSPR